jgi:hypothetical protein
MTLTITHGTSVIHAKPIFSSFRENPGPLVAVRLFLPTREAPITAAIAPISSSIWIKAPPAFGRRRDRNSAISVDGVIG